jgi:hypothetical protein
MSETQQPITPDLVYELLNEKRRAALVPVINAVVSEIRGTVTRDTILDTLIVAGEGRVPCYLYLDTPVPDCSISNLSFFVMEDVANYISSMISMIHYSIQLICVYDGKEKLCLEIFKK